jgi:hypothetical protein
MVSGTWGRRLRQAVLLLALSALPFPAAAADALLYRIFLIDGTSVVSYGEFARVADRVVFSIPVGGVDGGAPHLRLVSLAESLIDWARTERYAEAVRAKRYADTRGEEEFTRLSAQVARTLNDVAHTPDPKRRLQIAEQARTLLAAWPARNHGYRARDVAQLLSLLDEVVAELRVAAGEPRMELSLVAETARPAAVELMQAPSFRESIEQAFTVARTTPESTERVSLLGAIVQALEPARSESWAAALHAKASADLGLELRTEQAYSKLIAQTMAAAELRTRQADVKGLQKLIRSVLETDDRLGRRRPQATGALLATLDARLADARRLRLERDAYALRMNRLGTYRRTVRGAMDSFRESTAGLEEIRALSGPHARDLARLSDRVGRGVAQLIHVKPPGDVGTAHALLTSALQMAGQAIATRQRAIQSANMDLAWQASAAAAGALLMFERANEELDRLATPPRL